MSQITYYAIGSYTAVQGHVPHACGEGITLISFDEDRGVFDKVEIIDQVNNPSFLSWDRVNRQLYAVTESNEGSGLIQSYKRGENLHFYKNSSVTGPGKAGCHLAGDFKNEILYAVSYMEGTLKAYPLVKGCPDENSLSIQFKGDGPDKDRQESSHAHQVMVCHRHPFVYICDLGSDRIWRLGNPNQLSNFSTALRVPPGYGPRHLAFDPHSDFAFVLCELIPRLLLVKIDASDGSMKIIQDLSTVSDGEKRVCAPAAVKIHPSGKTLAVSNRFDDSISVFQIERDEMDLSLSFHSNFSSTGKTPRDITFSPSGKWLFIANQDSNDIQSRLFNENSGLPCHTWSIPLTINTPVCITALE